jgi:predicted ATPase
LGEDKELNIKLQISNFKRKKMLRQLYIKNFTLIDELDIEWHEGFSVMTGETGAGKSIILGAIGLLL